VRDAAARDSGLEFVMLRPAMLTDGEAKTVRFHGDDGRGVGFLPSITRKSVARAMVDAAESDEWVGESPVITN